jgi:amino acid adenylation domain-containing protein/non-ribosomal peptide synthase protein (TIGR01720 family)
MNKIENINLFLNELKHNDGAIWLEDGAINMSLLKKNQLEAFSDFIKNNKSRVIAILNENKIFSEETFQRVVIFKDMSVTYYPLSSGQERLWFIEQYEEGTNAYHIPSIFEFEKDTDKEGIKYALQQIVGRHEVLRSTIKQAVDLDQSIQVVHDKQLVVNELFLNEQDDYDRYIKEDINKPFDLSKDYPVRATIYTINAASEKSYDKTLLLINIHHIASDGWSMSIFFKELFLYYEAYIKNDLKFRIPALKIQYKDYALWQRTYLKSETLDSQLNYWKDKLSGYQPLELSTDYTRPNNFDYKGALERFTLNKEIGLKLKALARNHSVTLHSVMLASFTILLNKCSRQDDITIGCAIANRHLEQTEDLIGFFVNVQAQRIFLKKTQSFEELIKQVHKEQIEAQQHQDLPFERLVDELNIDRDPSRHPIFQVAIEVESFVQSYQKNKYLRPYSTATAYEIEKFDLSVYIADRGEEIVGQFSYATSLFKKETIERLIKYYLNLLDQLANNPSKAYSEFNLLDQEEYKQLVYDWNATDQEYEKNKAIHEWFELQVTKTPNNVALVFEGKALGYKELNERSNQLANHIRSQYKTLTKQLLKPDTLIALYVDRSLEMIIGILAILKAGGAYVPIDPNYPQDRIDFLIEDTKTELIICCKNSAENTRVKLPQKKVIYIDLTETFYQTEVTTNLTGYNNASDLAYVIYTSGTTGKPKGVMVEHHSVNNEVLSQLRAIPLQSADKSLLTTNIIFDAAVECIFMSLFSGGELHILSEKAIFDTDFIKQYVEIEKINVISTTPSYLNALALDLFSKHLHYIILGGEAYQVIETSAKIFNAYGPTETSIASTGGQLNGNEIHIGKPYDNTKVYILDQYNNPVPIGVVGELYIGGAGISRGYLNRPDLTAERFILNPFATKSDKQKGYSRLYKTGDLVRWLANGNIEYLGRNDDQVKIRGYRIELGEIEHALSTIEGIKQTSVLVKEKQLEASTTKHLVAYYVLENKGKITSATIQDKLSKLIPEFMVPTAFVELEFFPLTFNGKLDKKALPDPDVQSLIEYIAPQTNIEEKLCEIWQTVLNIDSVSTNANFFKIGGDSILSIQVSSRIRQAGFKCQVKDIFEYKTIAQLAAHLKKKKSEIAYKTEQGMLSGELEFLPIQKWFLEQVNNNQLPKYNHWNQSFLIKVPVLEVNKLIPVFQKLIAYHDALRIRYIKKQEGSQNNWSQVYEQTISLREFRTIDISAYTHEEIHTMLTDWQSDFDLEKGILFSVGYLHGYEDGSARIYFALHHMIVDSVSWRILAKDIQLLYSKASLPAKGSSYRQWVEQVGNYPNLNALEATYWKEQLKGIPTYPLQDIKNELSVDSFEISKALTKSLLQEISEAYHTEVNDLLLTALAYSLKDINHSTIQGITLEGHGREDIDPSIDHSGTVGWFTTAFPVRLEIKNSIQESIKFIKETLREIPNKGIGFGAFATNQENDYNFNDLPPITFNYLGQFDSVQEDWQIISESSGISIHPDNLDYNIIHINGMVGNGKLSFHIATRLGEKITKKLNECFKKQLTNIIKHCKEKIEKEGSSYTPNDFKSVNITQHLLDKLEISARLNQNEIAHIYPATSLQQGFIYHVLSQADDQTYRLQIVRDYYEEIDIDKYIQAWQYCLAQFPILRTAFNWEEEIIQIIYKHGKLEYYVHDISHLATKEEKDNAIAIIQEKDRKQNFDFTKPSLLRLHIIKQASAYYTILKTEHHSIIDGWSEPLLLSNLHYYYQKSVENKKISIIEDEAYLKTQEYISKNKETAHKYWLDNFTKVDNANDIVPLLDHPVDLSSYRQVVLSETCALEIKDDFYNKLKRFHQKEGITLNVIVQFMWHKLLQIYSSKPISVVGTTISGRDLPVEGIVDSVGLYINTLPLVIEWDNNNTILEQLHEIQKKTTEMNTYSFADLAKLQKEGERIFHSLFVFENYPTIKKSKGITKTVIRDIVENIDYPLFIKAYDSNNVLTIKFQYDAKYLSTEKARQYLETLENIIHQIVKEPYKHHSQISLINAHEREEILKWNSIHANYPSTNLVDICLADISSKYDRTAIIEANGFYTYQQINRYCYHIAAYLQEHQLAKTNLLIGILSDKGYQQVVSTLGIMRAGAAYLPLHIEWPEGRLDEVLIEGKVKTVLVSQTAFNDCVRGYKIENDYTWLIIEEIIELIPTINIDQLPKLNPSDVAYVIFTSGSTGKPKGVTISHEGAVNTIIAINEKFDVNKEDKVFALSELSFDLSVYDIFGLLAVGGAIVFPDQSKTKEPGHWHEAIKQHKVTIWNTVPQLMQLLVDYVNDANQNINTLKAILMSGDWIPVKLPKQIKVLNRHTTVMSLGGATEGSIWSIWFEIKEVNASWSSIPYGLAMPNQKMYVLNEYEQHCPFGVKGEIYIGGVGVAMGYWNDDSRTNERFIMHENLGRLYKTGDQGKWNKSGYIEFEGRNDDQVKIRGYRVELGEIESALSQIAGIKQCCVITKERKSESGTNKYLVGYYLLDSSYVSENDSDILDSWENLYDSEYEKDIEEINIQTDFSGWNSFVTGRPIPLTEMLEWRGNIVESIRKLKPENILEIGVGSGLLMYPLIDKVTKYVGVDLSAAVINRHLKYFKNKNYNVALHHLRADQIDLLPPDEYYDTVIINSVCQYFPSIHYFEAVLKKAIHKLSKNGAVFLGDIRNYDLLKELIKEKLEFKNENFTKLDIDRIVSKENELLISPSYFKNLIKKYPDIKVSVIARTDCYTSELSKYRYDVIISKQHKAKNTGVEITGLFPKQDVSGYFNIPYLNQLKKDDIINHLSAALPTYMIPDSLVVVESFPLTSNGKLDKRALPDSEFSSSNEEYIAPTTEIEKELCKIWQVVLGLNKVGVTDNFFTLGGNSIMAIQVSHRMSKALGCDVKVADLFKFKTISLLVMNSMGTSQINIPKANSNQVILSFAQERLWFIEQYEQGTNAYHIPMLFELDHDTDKEGIKYALQQIISRHEVLRSTIEQGLNLDHGVQIVHDEPLTIQEVVVADKENYESLIQQEIDRPFILEKEYPIRAILYAINPTSENSLVRNLLLINIHHISSDGWSMGIFSKELFAYYESYVKKDVSVNLPGLEIQYKDFALWQRSYLTGETLEKQLNYWKEKLSNYQHLELPIDFERPDNIDYRGAQENFRLKKAISQKLRALARSHGVTLHSVMLSSINVLLNKFTGQNDIIIGSAIANRHQRQTEDLIGFFVNMQAHRTLLNKTQCFEELIKQVHQEQIEAQLHQDLPFEKLVDELNVERDPSRHPIFQVMFEVQSSDETTKTSIHQSTYLKSFHTQAEYDIEKFDLSVYMGDNGEEIVGQFSYATSLFKKETIERLIRYYLHLLDQLANNPSKAYSKFSLLDQEEYKQLVYDWNATDQEYEKNKTIHELFELQVTKTPNNVALVFEGKALSYKELNERSNQLANHIRSQYKRLTKQLLKPDTLIAMYVDRSLEMVIGILAILKAGGAYVPIDPGYPQDRINFLIEDTKTELILCRKNSTENHPVKLPQEKVIYIDLTETFYQTEVTRNLTGYNNASHLAYVIYTSGTTGKPKGVMVEHKAFSQFIHNFDDYLVDEINLVPRDILSLTNYVFDIFGLEYALPLTTGGKITLSHVNDVSAEDILNSKIIQQTPSTLLHLITMYPDVLSSVTCLVGGEALLPSIAEKLVDKFHTVINVYGPAETVIWSSAFKVVNANKPNIGKPLPNEKMYILDVNGVVLPIGVVGELYIGGAGLSRGYLNRANLTTERFIPNSFATGADKLKGYTHLYKTGDLVKWLPDGNIEYIGRNDDQVKVNGHRIELGEIENRLTQIKGIAQGCVLVKEKNTDADKTKYLVGYYVLENNEEAINQTEILDKLSQVLPEYMIPSLLIEMKSFPLTVNGKVDKRAFPEVELHSTDGEHIFPATELEAKLCEIYAKILGLTYDQISTHQNFFRMGGNSILSIQLKRKLNKVDEFKHISIADLFKYNSIKKLVQSIQQSNLTSYNLQEHKPAINHEIAIIATSGAFSGVKNIAEFWTLISNQKEGIQFHTEEECKKLDIDPSLLSNVNYVPVSAQVKDIELFDPIFWDISPNEAKQLDPQIRKFLEHCWFALESAGYTQQRKNHSIGVFAGSGYSSYFYDHILNGEMAEQINMWEASSSNSKDALTTKAAFLLGLTGPANSINTACSTGLVSIVEACQKLQLGKCNMALAGGVSFSLPDQIGYVYQEGMILSKDGHCKTFDQDASGTIGGSGVGVVLLKRMEDAVKDKDTILGVIKGYATNNDGDRKTSYTAPSVTGQSECIINAQRMAGVTPDQIDYIECHGTATNLGDQIEVQALKEAFNYNIDKENNLKHKTVLGSVKANIGHTDSAAGTAGLIKVCAMLQNEIIPGQGNFNTPNSELHLNQSPFEIIRENRTWSSNANRQRIAGVSSFGIGGTNAHVIIGDYNASIATENKPETTDVNYVIPISAKNRHSLKSYKQSLLTYLTDTKSNKQSLRIQDIAYSLQERRVHFSCRIAYSAKNIDQLISKLKHDASSVETDAEINNKVAFMFPGQGVQYIGMAKELYNNDLFFKSIVDTCIQLANQYLEVDLYSLIYADEEKSTHDINETQWTQISLFIIEYSLATYLEHVGIKPEVYIGHSIGEYVAATLAGVFRLEDAIKIVITRGKLMQAMQPGNMLAICANEETISAIVKKHECEIALINSAEDIVVSGKNEAIQKLKEELDKNAFATIKLNTSHAYHSSSMDQAARDFENVFRNVKLNKPEKNFLSNLSGQLAQEEVTTALYWCKQLRNTVQFAKGIDNLSKKYNHEISFIEVGVGKGLSYFVNKYKNANGYKSIYTCQLLPAAKEAKDENIRNSVSKEDILAKLWMSGIVQKPNDLSTFKDSTFVQDLPLYQFNYQKCWINKSTNLLLNSNQNNLINLFNNELDELTEFTKEQTKDLLKRLLTQNKQKIRVVSSAREINIVDDNYTEKEFQLAQIYVDILGVEQISIYDDFFKIGGNSILAIQASQRISNTLGYEVKIGDLFRLKSINKLVNDQEPYFELVKSYQLDYSLTKPDLVFISPGRAGSEMYQDLSELLTAKYNCIGIDNYNIHNEEKINSLSLLADHYLSLFEKKFGFKDPINLFGWSLGGQIALEMAVNLEKRGFRNINVVLLDTFIRDEYMISLSKKNRNSIKQEKSAMSESYDVKYVEKVFTAIDAEEVIMNTDISSYLQHAKVTLFKATQELGDNSSDENSKLISDYYLQLSDNNINMVAKNVNLINLDCNHYNIIQEYATTISNHLLSERILSSMKNHVIL